MDLPPALGRAGGHIVLECRHNMRVVMDEGGRARVSLLLYCTRPCRTPVAVVVCLSSANWSKPANLFGSYESFSASQAEQLGLNLEHERGTCG